MSLLRHNLPSPQTILCTPLRPLTLYQSLLMTLCGITCGFSAVSAESKSRRVFVDSSRGNDALGDGSERNPWKSIQFAAVQMNLGDVCVLRAGIYRETVMGRIVRTEDDTLHCDQTNLRWYRSRLGEIDGPGN